MMLPFTREEFFDTFVGYNSAVWPAQLLLAALALASLALLFRPGRLADAIISIVLAFFWAWMAVAYHLAFFTAINPLAYAFSALFLLQAAIFLWQGLVRRRLRFGWQTGIRGTLGSGLVILALIVYPVLSRMAGHTYPAVPSFGLPCPTTIFTLGMLAFAVPPAPRAPLVVPFLWCLTGTQAAFLLGVPQDLTLVLAGIAAVYLWCRPAGPRHSEYLV